MQVGIEIKCMHTSFGGHDLSSFRDIATFKNGQISLLGMDYSPWSLKNLINRNRFKKFMQVGVDITCMHINFDGWSLSSFGDEISLWSIKVEKFNQSKSAKKIMQVGVNVTCMCISFGGCGLSGFRDIATFQKRPNFPFGAWTLKNLIDQNRLKKFTKVGIDVKCMHTDFGGRGLSGFRDKISLWSIKVEKFNLSKSAQKIHASRDRYQVHAHQFWWALSLRF